MPQKKRLPKHQLKQLLIERGILEGIHRGRYTEVVQANVPARDVPGGRSLILSYYESGRYICTKHELKTKKGETVHQDIEDVFLDGTRYERL